MKTYWDSSALVSLLHRDSPFYAWAKGVWAASEERATCRHALAESYRTMTSLQKPVPPDRAADMVRLLQDQIEMVEGHRDLYDATLARMGERGLSGPLVYDCLHAMAAEFTGADQIVTRNGSHFRLVTDLELAEPTA